MYGRVSNISQKRPASVTKRSAPNVRSPGCRLGQYDVRVGAVGRHCKGPSRQDHPAPANSIEGIIGEILRPLERRCSCALDLVHGPPAKSLLNSCVGFVQTGKIVIREESANLRLNPFGRASIVDRQIRYIRPLIGLVHMRQR